MMMTELRGGLLVHPDAIALVLDLEQRGHICRVTDGGLRVSNGKTLTPADYAAIARLRLHLLAIASYEPPDLSSSSSPRTSRAIPSSDGH